MAGDISRMNGRKHVAIADSPAVRRMRVIAEKALEKRFEDMIEAQLDAAIGIGEDTKPDTGAARFVTEFVIPKKVEVQHSGGIGVLHLIQSLSDPQEADESYGTE